MEAEIVIRDNATEKEIRLGADLPGGDIRFLNEIGERIAQATGYGISVLAVELKE